MPRAMKEEYQESFLAVNVVGPRCL